jgi:hypothetical protein
MLTVAFALANGSNGKDAERERSAMSDNLKCMCGAVYNTRFKTICPACGIHSSFAAPDGSATYRLLNRSDAMCPGDERLLDDCKTWEVIEPTNPHIGQRYDGNLFVPMRRRSLNDLRELPPIGDSREPKTL